MLAKWGRGTYAGSGRDTAAAAAAEGGSNEALVVEMHGMRILHGWRAR